MSLSEYNRCQEAPPTHTHTPLPAPLSVQVRRAYSFALCKQITCEHSWPVLESLIWFPVEPIPCNTEPYYNRYFLLRVKVLRLEGIEGKWSVLAQPRIAADPGPGWMRMDQEAQRQFLQHQFSWNANLGLARACIVINPINRKHFLNAHGTILAIF